MIIQLVLHWLYGSFMFHFLFVYLWYCHKRQHQKPFWSRGILYSPSIHKVCSAFSTFSICISLLHSVRGLYLSSNQCIYRMLYFCHILLPFECILCCFLKSLDMPQGINPAYSHLLVPANCRRDVLEQPWACNSVLLWLSQDRITCIAKIKLRELYPSLVQHGRRK